MYAFRTIIAKNVLLPAIQRTICQLSVKSVSMKMCIHTLRYDCKMFAFADDHKSVESFGLSVLRHSPSIDGFAHRTTFSRQWLVLALPLFGSHFSASSAQFNPAKLASSTSLQRIRFKIRSFSRRPARSRDGRRHTSSRPLVGCEKIRIDFSSSHAQTTLV